MDTSNEYEPGIEALLNPSLWRPIAQEIRRLEQAREIEKRMIFNKIGGMKEVLLNHS